MGFDIHLAERSLPFGRVTKKTSNRRSLRSCPLPLFQVVQWQLGTAHRLDSLLNYRRFRGLALSSFDPLCLPNDGGAQGGRSLRRLHMSDC